MGTTTDPPGAVLRWTPKTLAPSSFAFVMASGIVGVGASLRGLTTLAAIVVAVTSVGYGLLVLATIWRLVAYRPQMLTDLRDPRRAFGYFTFVAATGVVAVCAVAAGRSGIALALLVVATAAWFVLGYAVPWMALFGPRSHPSLVSADGTWLVWVVASQSVAVLAATLEPAFESLRAPLAVLAVFTWSVGLAHYAVTGVFVSLRLLLHGPDVTEVDASYWVCMGALAITVVAGARIVEMDNTPVVAATRGVIAGLAVILWSFASWLIPVLVAVGFWRHVVRRVPLRYEPSLWSLVFPFGMYAVAGMYLGRADSLPFVEVVGQAWFWVALAAWALTGAGMLGSVLPPRRR